MALTCDSTIDLQTTMRSRFGHRAFRPGQDEVVTAVLGGRDVLAVMPTGSGKSLGYQLPAVILPATTVVVSPADLIDERPGGPAQSPRHSIRRAALDAVNRLAP